MSELEFDNYLAIVSGMLRLTKSQQEAISGELRDHLEQRLSELLKRGVPRRKAIKIALEEFGDAAGLAADFATVQLVQRRRWIMRYSTACVAALAVAAMITAAVWPDAEQGPAPKMVIAQEGAGEAVKKEAEPEVQKKSLTSEEMNLLTESKLAERTKFEYFDQPLTEVLEDLAERMEVQFYLDELAFEEDGQDTGVLVTFRLENVRGDVALDLLFERQELAYLIRDGIVIVTTPSKLEEMPEVRIYNCRDLLMPETLAKNSKRRPQMQGAGAMGMGDMGMGEGMVGGGMGMGGMSGMLGSNPQFSNEMLYAQRAELLMRIIETTIEPDRWSTVGGVGSLAHYNGLLVIAQTADVHKEIDRVLAMLRKATAAEPGTAIRSN